MIEEVKKFLKELKEEEIEFSPHFYERAESRPINENLVRDLLKKPNTLFGVEKGRKNRSKWWFKLSNKYSLVVICRRTKKHLYIISAWNTNRRWQKSIQK